jgi:uncharacterized protein YfaP (DUF2135 family)
MGEEICFFNGVTIPNPSDFNDYTINVDANSNSITAIVNGKLLFTCVDNRFNMAAVQYFSFATCCGVNPVVALVRSSPLGNSFNVQKFTPNPLPGDATFPDQFSPNKYEGFPTWKTEWQIPTPGKGRISFKAKFGNDLHIAVSPNPSVSTPMYQIILGGWSNTRSVIRNRLGGEEICFYNGIRIWNQNWNDYVIDIDSTSKTIYVYFNRQLFLACTDRNFQPNVAYFSFAYCCGPDPNPLIAAVSTSNINGYATQATQTDQNPKDRAYDDQFVPTRYEGFPDSAWNNNWTLPRGGQGRIQFKAKMGNDIHVAISPIMGESNPMYQLIIGGWSNTRTVLRNRKGGEEICFQNFGANRGGMIHNLDWNDITVDVDSKSKGIYVWFNRVLIFVCADRNFQPNVRFFSFAYCCGGTQNPLIAAVRSSDFNGYNNFPNTSQIVVPTQTDFKIRGFIRNQVDAVIDDATLSNGNAKVTFVDANGNVVQAKILPGGIYEVVLTRGIYTRVGSVDGYVKNTRTGLQINVDSNETNLENRILMSLAFDGWKVVLTWNGVVQDLDGIIVTPEGAKVVYNNRSSPDGKVTLDKDVTTGFGPETMSLTGITNGTYQYWVRNYSINYQLKDSEGVATIYKGSEELGKVTIPQISSQFQSIHLFDILPQQNTFKVVNEFGQNQ